ncbi:hypothetical protein BZG36_04813 [Bifiguratus adelaidae]|uniref:Pentacotripeptide-repeat region of PRORP domain-containing protein n=1 Tax=Bifiguratus adelaidae TaxID=1938954 RepID=A0A261XTZ2_9FUNG|nr:hypothetical protein BZG36_04813 [Bifiguratus adelaidae]
MPRGFRGSGGCCENLFRLLLLERRSIFSHGGRSLTTLTSNGTWSGPTLARSPFRGSVKQLGSGAGKQVGFISRKQTAAAVALEAELTPTYRQGHLSGAKQGDEAVKEAQRFGMTLRALVSKLRRVHRRPSPLVSREALDSFRTLHSIKPDGIRLISFHDLGTLFAVSMKLEPQRAQNILQELSLHAPLQARDAHVMLNSASRLCTIDELHTLYDTFFQMASPTIDLLHTLLQKYESHDTLTLDQYERISAEIQATSSCDVQMHDWLLSRKCRLFARACPHEDVAWLVNELKGMRFASNALHNATVDDMLYCFHITKKFQLIPPAIEYVIQHDFHLEDSTYGALVSDMAKSGQLQIAQELVQHTSHFSTSEKNKIYIQIIKNLVPLRRQNVPDWTTIVDIILENVRGCQLALGTTAYAAVISAYSSRHGSDAIHQLQRLFDGCESNVKSLKAVLYRLRGQGEAIAAGQLLMTLQKRQPGILSDIQLVSEKIIADIAATAPRTAIDLYLTLVDPTADRHEVLSRKIIQAAFEAGEPAFARSLLDSLASRGYQPTILQQTQMLLGYVQTDCLDAAESLVTRLEDGSLRDEPTVEMGNILINGYVKRGDTYNADRVFRRMLLDWRAKPDIVTFNTLLHGHALDGNFDRCRYLLDCMSSLGLWPDNISISTLLGGLTKANRIDAALSFLDRFMDTPLFKDMASNRSTADITGSLNQLLSAYALQGSLEGCERTFACLKSLNKVTCVSLQSMLIIYGKSDRRVEYRQTWEEMKQRGYTVEKGLRPIVSYWLERTRVE